MHTLTREQRNRELAIYHANLIQARKDVEAEVLQSLELLIDFPRSSCSPSRPCVTDVQLFRKLIQLFQASDYDDLIEERVAAGRCGYVFCSYALKQIDGCRKDKMQLVKVGTELRFLPADKMKKWCDGNMCAKRAMYIKLQLSETPAWERVERMNSTIDLLPEDDNDINTEEVGSRMPGLRLESAQSRISLEAMKELALERGQTRQSNNSSMLIRDSICERDVQEIAEAPISGDDMSYLRVEGYLSNTTTPREQ